MARHLLVVLAFISFFSVAQADEDTSNFYYGLAIGGGEIDIDPSSTIASSVSDNNQSDIKDYSFVLGYELFSFLSLEAQLGLASNDNGSVFGDGVVNRAAGLARINYPADRINAYALLGVGVVNYDFAGVTTDEVGPAIGLGLDLFGTDTTALTLGAMFQPGDDIDYSAINVGFRHYFGGAK